jgi:HJR/Mrr/RecB family endonuclease
MGASRSCGQAGRVVVDSMGILVVDLVVARESRDEQFVVMLNPLKG